MSDEERVIEAISDLEDAVSDLRWALRSKNGVEKHASFARAHRLVWKALDHMDSVASENIRILSQ